MTGAKHKSEVKITKDIPYLTIMGELWGVCCEDFAENWSRYNDTVRHIQQKQQIDLMVIGLVIMRRNVNCSNGVIALMQQSG